MRSFKLGAVEIVLRLDAPKIVDIRNALQIDLAAADCSQFERLTSDPVLAQSVLWRLCREQAKSAALTEEAFYSLLSDGDQAEQAAAQLFEAIIDFFPNRQQREALRRMLAENRAAMAATSEAVMERLDKANISERLKTQALARFDAELAKLFGNTTPSASATDSLESSAAE